MKSFFRSVASSLILFPSLLLAQTSPSCGNDGQRTPQDAAAEVSDPINPYQGNMLREVTDITTFGAAPITFTRHVSSRTLSFNTPYWDFGRADTWQHNWNYEMRQLSTKTFGFFDIKLRYPDGREYNFAATDATGTQLAPTADCGDRLYRWSGSTVGYNMITPSGTEYHFQRIGSPKFQMIEVRDGQGAIWTIAHDSNAAITRITNNFGRYLDIARAVINGVSCITTITTSDGRQVSYFYSTWVADGSAVLASVTYPGGEQASYSWVGSDSPTTGRALLATASDPTVSGAGAQFRFLYNYNAIFNYGAGPYLVTGTLLSQLNLVTDALVVTLPQGGGANATITQGSGAQVGRTFANGQLSAITDAAGRLTQFSRTMSGFGYIAAKIAPNGGTTSYARDYAGRVLSLTNATGAVSSKTYNPAGFLTSFTDELGHLAAVTRDSANLPARVDYPDGSYEANTFNSKGEVLTHRLRNGGTTTNVYYATGQAGGAPGDLKTFTDTLNHTSTFTYDAAGRVATQTDPLGHTTSFAYNWRGQPLTITNADGSAVSYQYDAFGNRTRATDELGQITQYAYNEYQHLVSVTDPLGRITQYQYGLYPGDTSAPYAGTVTRIFFPSGKKVERTYDSSSKLIAETVAPGTAEAATRLWAYNAGADIASATDPLGHVANFAYDLKHRLLSATDPLNHTTTQTYDAAGNALTVSRADGGVTANVYDAMSRLTRSTDPKGQVTQYVYDAAGNPLTLTDARGKGHTYAYDQFNRRTRLTYPDGSHEDWTYDLAGNLATYTTRSSQIRTSAYDARNRELASDWSDATPDLARTYDAAGHLLSLSTGTLSSGVLTSTQTRLTYAYDAAGQLTSETSALSALSSSLDTKTVAYSYDADGNAAGLVYPDGTALAYGYSARNQLASIAVNGGAPLAAYSYDLAGRRIGQTLENGTSAVFTYDVADRLLEVDHFAGAGAFAAFTYGYNVVNNRTAMASAQPGLPALTDNYGYDAVDQLTAVGYGTGRNVAYAYDATGNRQSVTDSVFGASTYTANNLNQYTAVADTGGTRTPTYDGNGNFATQAGWSYAYDAQNRLVSAAGDTQRLDLVYDGRNRPVHRTAYARSGAGAGWVQSESYALAYDGWKVIAEYTDANVERALYFHGPGADELLLKVDGSGSAYYHRDALGSARVLTGPAGAALESYTYDAFGVAKVFDASGAALAGSAQGNRFLYTGREWLAGLQLYDYRNRLYSADLGRFIQTDPLRFGGKDVNLYRYVANGPVITGDPTGEILPLIAAIVGIGAGVNGSIQAGLVLSHGGSAGDAARAFGKGAVSGALGTLAGLGVAAVSGNPYLIGAAAGFTTNVTGQLLDGKSLNQLDARNAAIATAAGALGGRAAENPALALRGRHPDLFTDRAISEYGANSLRELAKEAVTGVASNSAEQVFELMKNAIEKMLDKEGNDEDDSSEYDPAGEEGCDG